MVGCRFCHQGERLPVHPIWKDVDYYCFILDNVQTGKVPVFKYETMNEMDLTFRQKNITLGKIEVAEVASD